MKKTIGLTLMFVGLVLFCALNSSYYSGNGIDAPRQTVALGAAGSPWLSFTCVSFADNSPSGCAQWQTSIHWSAYSWLGLVAVGLGFYLARQRPRV